MARNDTIADALTCIKNGVNAAKGECVVKPSSKLLGEILKLMKEKGRVNVPTKAFLEVFRA